MTTLKELIEAKLILDEASIHRESDRIYYGANAITWREGARWQHDKLKNEVLPILLECAEALNFYSDKANWYRDFGCEWVQEMTISIKDDCHGTKNSGGKRAKRAISRLRKWSEGK